MHYCIHCLFDYLMRYTPLLDKLIIDLNMNECIMNVMI